MVVTSRVVQTVSVTMSVIKSRACLLFNGAARAREARRQDARSALLKMAILVLDLGIDFGVCRRRCVLALQGLLKDRLTVDNCSRSELSVSGWAGWRSAVLV